MRNISDKSVEKIGTHNFIQLFFSEIREDNKTKYQKAVQHNRQLTAI